MDPRFRKLPRIVLVILGAVFLAHPAAVLAQFSTRISPTYSPDSTSIRVLASDLSPDGRWYYFQLKNYPEDLHFFDRLDNTRYPIDTSAFTGLEPVGIVTEVDRVGPHHFIFVAKEAAVPSGDQGLWSMEMPSGTPVKISENISDGEPVTGTLTTIDQVAFTPDEAMVVYRATYEYTSGTRYPQAIQTYRFSDGAHFLSSPTPQTGERQIASFLLDPASWRVAYVSELLPGTDQHLFTAELTFGLPHDITPPGGGNRIVPGSHYEFNAEGHRLVFDVYNSVGVPDVWTNYWLAGDPIRVAASAELRSRDGQFDSNGNVFYRTITNDAPFNYQIYRARYIYVHSSQSLITLLGRNAVSIPYHLDEVTDFKISPDNAHVAYRYEDASGDSELHIVQSDGANLAGISPSRLTTLRTGDYYFTPDSAYIYSVLRAVGTTRVLRTSTASPATTTTLLNLPLFNGIDLLEQGNFYVVRVSGFGIPNWLYSVRHGSSLMRKWVKDGDPNGDFDSEIVRPHLEPDGCAIFYAQFLNIGGMRVWHARCATRAILPPIDGRWLKAGFFQIEFLPRLGFIHTLSFSDTLEDPWSEIGDFTDAELPWVDYGQETGGPPLTGARFYRLTLTPHPYTEGDP